MIPFKSYRLKNGLVVLANRDQQSKLAAVNLLYKVGLATKIRPAQDLPISLNI